MKEIEALGVLKAETKNSIYYVNPVTKTYVRTPKTEGPGTRHTASIDGALDDLREVPYDRLWLTEYLGNPVLRILPSGRPEGSWGIFTSALVAIGGSWQEVDDG